MGQLPRRGLWAGSKATPATLTVPSPVDSDALGLPVPPALPTGSFLWLQARSVIAIPTAVGAGGRKQPKKLSVCAQ